MLPHLDDGYRLARWLTGERADAEDVVQEACVDAFRGIAGFAGGNARAWVLTIVRHAAYRWLRKNRPAALVSVADLDPLADAQPGQTPEAALIAGLTGVGIASGPAVAGVLAFRLATFWLPIIPGYLAFHSLTRRELL